MHRVTVGKDERSLKKSAASEFLTTLRDWIGDDNPVSETPRQMSSTVPTPGGGGAVTEVRVALPG